MNQKLKPSVFKEFLVSSNFDLLDIDCIFRRYNIEEDSDNSDEVELSEEICIEIIKKLNISKKRILDLNKGKMSFLKPIWYQKTESYLDIPSILKSNSNSFRISLAESGTSEQRVVDKTVSLTINDEIKIYDYDNFFTEFTSWKEFERVKFKLEEIENDLNELANFILSTCQNRKLFLDAK